MLVVKIVLGTEMVSPGSSMPSLMAEGCFWKDTTTLRYEDYIAAVAGGDAVEMGRCWKKSRCLSDMRKYFGPFGRTRRARLFKAGQKSLVLTHDSNDMYLATRAHKRRRFLANRALEANIHLHPLQHPQSRATPPRPFPFWEPIGRPRMF